MELLNTPWSCFEGFLPQLTYHIPMLVIEMCTGRLQHAKESPTNVACEREIGSFSGYFNSAGAFILIRGSTFEHVPSMQASKCAMS